MLKTIDVPWQRFGIEYYINYGILFKHLNSEFIIELNTMLCWPVMKVEIWYLSVIYHHILNMVKNLKTEGGLEIEKFFVKKG